MKLLRSSRFLVPLLLIVLFAACQKRYAHVAKVRVDKKAPVVVKHKKKAVQPFIAPVFPVAPGEKIAGRLVISKPEPPAQVAGKPHRTKLVLPPAKTAQDDSTDEEEEIIPPEISDVKINRSNAHEVFWRAMQLLVIAVLASFVVTAVVLALGLAGAVFLSYGGGVFVVVWSLIGLAAFYPLVLLVRWLTRKLRSIKIKYAGIEYTQPEMEFMPRNIRLKRAWHNFLTSVLFLGVSYIAIFLLAGFILLPGAYLAVLYYFFKMLGIFFFAPHA